MARTVSYSPADKKKLKVWVSPPARINALRVVNLVRPACAVCQGPEGPGGRWWENCEHDPYWSSQVKATKKTSWETDEEGDEVEKEVVVKRKRTRVPNLVEVAWNRGSNAGIGPQLFKNNKGFVDMEAIGLAPRCMISGCVNAWPGIETAEGRFCSEIHARLVAADEREIFITSGVIDHGFQGGARGKLKSAAEELQEINI